MEHTLTQSDAIEMYTPYEVIISRPRKMAIAFFVNFGGIEKLFFVCGQELKVKNYESVQNRLKFSGIKKGDKKITSQAL